MSLTNTGYNAPEITELVENMSDNAKAAFGSNMDTSTDSALGHFIGVTSIEIVKVFEDLTEFYAQLNANTAEGRMLENLALLGGLIRKDTTYSTGIVDFTGTVGTSIAEGTRLHVLGDTTKEFAVGEARTVSPTGNVRCQVISTVKGAIAAPAGTLTELVIPVVGLTVTNIVDITLGTDEIETEESFRARRHNTLSVGGNGTPAAIRASLEQIKGVVTAKVITNPTYSFVERGGGSFLRPPNSIECVIEGGDENVIIETIALTKSATTDTFGFLMAFYQDIVGNSHQIRFSRPEFIDVDISITYTLYSEEAFPQDGEGRIVEEILSFAAIEYVLGKDVIRDRIYEPVLQIQGISTIEVRVALAGETLGELNLSIEEYQRVNIQASNITVIKS